MDTESAVLEVSNDEEVIEIIDIEEGELKEHDEQNKNKTKFEIIFEDNNEYEKLADAIANILKENLPFVSGRKFEFLKSTCKIQAFEQIEKTSKETRIKIDDEIHEIDSDGNDSIDFGDSLNKLFMIDATPSDTLESGRVPSYKRVRMRKTVLDDEVQPKKTKNKEEACPRPRPSSSCFNCGSFEHGLRDCSEPRNFQRIARAKRTHLSKGERYHVDVDQRFAHLRPGVLSDKLKKALGLRSKELPSFYHRMRIFGYPPGWLEEAKVSHSGLAMFNSGDDVLKSDENSSDSESGIKYDISKIIEFPGFNVMPHDYRDDYKFYNVPKYGLQFSKESMISALGDNAIKGFKRKKIKDHTEAPSTFKKPDTTFNLVIQEKYDNDMEIEDGEVDAIENIEFTRPMPPPSPEEDDNLPPPLPIDPEIETDPIITAPLLTETTESQCPNRAKSPTLEELEAKQRDLLVKLGNGDDSMNEALKIAIVPPATKTPAAPETPSTPITPLSNDNDLKSVVKCSHMGTPVLKFSPYEKVPSGDNFKVGVSDVINFENLPDSTGKYEAMKVVIGKVRSIKKRLEAEDD